MYQIWEDQGLNVGEFCSHRVLPVEQGSRMHSPDVKRGTVSASFINVTVTAGDAARSALSVPCEIKPFRFICACVEVCTEAGSLQCAFE